MRRHMLRAIRILLVLIAISAVTGSPQPVSLDQEVPRLLAQHHVPSVSIAEIEDGRIVRVSAYGMQTASEPATPRTLYNIASMTKPISAETELRLISSGAFGLDDPIYKIWVDPDIANDPRNKLLTPRICLSHLTGFASNWRSSMGNVLQFKNDPGKVYLYSGEGYEYLSHFVERKTGANLEENAKKLVFGPIGMKDTSYTLQPWFEGRVATPAYESSKWLTSNYATQPVASDLLYTTAEDYAKFLLSVMRNDGLSQAIAAERSRVQFSLKPEICPRVKGLCPDEVGPGLGWQIAQIKGKRYLTHTGHDPGLYTFGYVSADTQSGIVIFTNGENGSKLIAPILQALRRDLDFVKFLAAMIQ
ncbi:MAG: beta-lactamase [Edaphobacter sp.]|nr:beta-lactamase [Edaphobacter sp.]